MTRWEYRLVRIDLNDSGADRLNKLGVQGWEAVGLDDHMVLLKRARPARNTKSETPLADSIVTEILEGALALRGAHIE